MSSTAGPERPKCVQRSEPGMEARLRPDPERTSSTAGTLEAAERAHETAGGHHEGHQPREDPRRQRVTERRRQRIAAAVGARLGQAAAPGREKDARGAHHLAVRGREAKRLALARDRRHPERMPQDDAGRARRATSASSTVRARSVTRKSLPVSLALELHAELAEERDRQGPRQNRRRTLRMAAGVDPLNALSSTS